VKISHALDGRKPHSGWFISGSLVYVRFLLFVAVLVVVVLFAGTAAGGALSWRVGRLSTRRALIVAVEVICATGKVVIFVLADLVPIAFFAYF
jgi:hypothetical protein